MNSWILFENLCFAIYTIHTVICTTTTLENIDAITNLYNSSSNYTNVGVRYAYLYLLSIYLPHESVNDCWMYILHLPPTYNTYVEPTLHCLSLNLFQIVKFGVKLVYTLLFYMTMRVYPGTRTIHPRYLYWGTTKLLCSVDIFSSVMHISIMYILKVLRVVNYPSYKMYKYVYHYKYNFQYDINFDPVHAHHYLYYHIVTAGYCQPFIDTPKFAHVFHNLLQHTFQHLVYKYYIYNILDCAFTLTRSYLDDLTIGTILIGLMYATESSDGGGGSFNLVRTCATLVFPHQWVLWWLLLNKEVYVFVTIVYEKYVGHHVAVEKLEKIILDEDFYKL